MSRTTQSAIPQPTAIDHLRTLVDSSGLTRSEIAGRAGMKPGDLTRLLSGTRGTRVSLDLVRRVLVAIGRRWTDLDPIA